ncbi:MAG: HD domain-containing protein [Euryarchaeota archaeon]|nr:HD domain-containing protein [Euryarchaeota archaeon]
MIERDEALQLLKKYLKNEKHTQHSLAVEAIMREMARMSHEDEELWGLTGLLHDIDYGYTEDTPEKHTMIAAQILEGLLPQEGIEAIQAHNYKHTGRLPINALDRALVAADAVSGLVIATALIIPSKKLADVKPETLLNKYKDKTFAARCERKRIELCADTGFELEQFLQISLTALQKIADKLDM